mmetsp:Transcript_1686/g.2218  ORF Transcript_1686/g.2218 Transcript_1686/m.2218 type:complete len:140 (-) Transcript_1686:334-753(-)|eukprot:CAMPEP_0197342950 /NCGR_PEP_ID=MMETSP0892-20130614/47184_1 /TAXON_ID=44058 ORGANISM="Aureoumbra lagunensis, Strain CCMP1510" /NCGR_SAMPLE_ID=MMETSP0892 /ASSEMBLY_ACC=CAM_ASM_000538 /LENGTH=139 /DNA_ID=CAMNT_0042848215 /DNA_START=219 /DNA_END=638 /DNA_ORIENTATION=+
MGVSLVATVKEDLPADKEGEVGEVVAFQREFWPDADIYLDQEMKFYQAIGGGSPKKSSLASFLMKLANPFSQLLKNVKKSKGVNGNYKGEGFIHGGVYVVKKGAAENETPIFVHQEAEIGDHPPTDELIAACQKAADAS